MHQSPPTDRVDLPVCHLKLRFRALDDLRLPPYAGSAWRGAFGHALKRTVCVTREAACEACLLYQSCSYPYLFETPPPPDAGKMRRYDHAPHPLVIRPQARSAALAPCDQLDLELVMVGRALRYLPYVIHALQQAASQGLGADRNRLDLMEVVLLPLSGTSGPVPVYRPGERLDLPEALAPSPPPVPDALGVELITPLRLRRDGRYVRPGGFAFADLFGPLLRRVSMLSYFHWDNPHETDFAALMQAARGVAIRNPRLRWQDWTRYSSRQGSEVPMGGLVGSFELDGGLLEPFWPYLWLGKWLHVGKGTVMGLGRYRLDLSTSLSATAPGSHPDQDGAEI